MISIPPGSPAHENPPSQGGNGAHHAEDLQVLATIGILFAGGCILAHIAGPEPAARAIGVALRPLGLLGHPAWFVCPFCGGTRSFLACCAGQWRNAAGFSLAGITAFAYLGSQGALRCVRLILNFVRPGTTSALRRMTDTALAALSRVLWVMAALLAAWVIQIALHYGGVLPWRVLSP